jgi:hypothetical protein
MSVNSNTYQTVGSILQVLDENGNPTLIILSENDEALAQSDSYGIDLSAFGLKIRLELPHRIDDLLKPSTDNSNSPV